MEKKIIHAGIDNGSILMYACNQACGITQGKIDFSWKRVTCKNCLDIIKKYDRSEKDGCIMLGTRKRSNINYVNRV